MTERRRRLEREKRSDGHPEGFSISLESVLESGEEKLSSPSVFLSSFSFFLFLSVFHSFFGSKRNITIIKKLGWWCLDVKVDEASSRYTTSSLLLPFSISVLQFSASSYFLSFQIFLSFGEKEWKKKKEERELMWNLKTLRTLYLYILFRFDSKLETEQNLLQKIPIDWLFASSSLTLFFLSSLSFSHPLTLTIFSEREKKRLCSNIVQFRIEKERKLNETQFDWNSFQSLFISCCLD